jgi:hypothetical protein
MLTNDDFEFALKEMYPDDVMKDLAIMDNPFLGMVPKDEDAVGELIKVPVVYANPQGRSATFSTAVTNKGKTRGVAFLIERAEDYALASISRHTIKASRNNEGAFAQAIETEMDGTINTCVRSLAKQLYGSGSGSLGQVAVSGISTVTLTLADINDVTNFEVGMVLKADTVDGGGTVNSGSQTISGIDRDLGTLTAATNWTTGIASLADGDYLFQEGDYDLMVKGLAAWIPTTAPTGADSFWNVNRSVDVSRLAGIRMTGTGMPVEQALLKLAARIGREKGKPDIALINDVQYHQMIISLGSKAEYVRQGVTADVFYSGVVLHGPKGPIEVYPDPNCPSGLGYILTLKSWKLYSIDAAPHIFDEGEGQEKLREATTDGYEVRVGYYAQLGCNAPGHNGVVSLDAATF